jgi:plastocyanin
VKFSRRNQQAEFLMETIASAPASKSSRVVSPPSREYRRQGVDYQERTAVQELHADIKREERNPRVTIKPFSLWVLVVVGLAFFCAGFWSARTGARFIATSTENRNSPPSESTVATVQPGVSPASVAQGSVANANASAVVHVTIKNMKFEPPKLEIHQGDTVEWKNEDITPHTATSAPLFDSGSIDSDKSWRHTFTEPGNFPYSCTFHPEMKAAVTVN